jgi:large subunit ribosomal protein L23
MDIIIKPIITEKRTLKSEKLNEYGFVVNTDANKVEIKSAVEKMYGVTVERVNTLVTLGKMRSRSTRSKVSYGKNSNLKKAFVKLKAGDSIDFFASI